MKSNIKIIVNADDFGWTKEITDAVYESFRERLITDTTIMSNGKAYDYAISVIKKDEEFSKRIGLHINLTQGEPLCDSIKKCPRLVTNGQMTNFLTTKKAKIFGITMRESKALFEEVGMQISKLRESGIDITHVDSHQHVHTNPFVMRLIKRQCDINGIKKIRIQKNVIKNYGIKKLYCRLFNERLKKDGFVTTDYFGNLIEYSNRLFPGYTYEIMVHPDYTKSKTLVNRTGIDYNKDIMGAPLKTGMQYFNQCNDIKLLSYSELE